MAVIWSMWVIRVFLARRCRSWLRGWETSVSVLIPVAGEEPDLFREVRIQNVTPYVDIGNRPAGRTAP